MHRALVQSLLLAATLCTVLAALTAAPVAPRAVSSQQAGTLGGGPRPRPRPRLHYEFKPRPRRPLNDPSGKDVAIRAAGTVSTHLHERWIWAWLGAELLWKGFATATALFVGGCTIAGLTGEGLTTAGKWACGVGIALSMIATVGAYAAAVSAARAASATQAFELTSVIEESFLNLNRRDGAGSGSNLADDPAVQKAIALAKLYRFHHAGNGSLVTLAHMRAATAERPLAVFSAGTQAPSLNYTVWSDRNPANNRTTLVSKFSHPLLKPAPSPPAATAAAKRDTCIQVDSNTEYLCGSGSNPSGNPSDWFVGIDMYGSNTNEELWDADIGIAETSMGNNGYLSVAEGLGTQITNDNTWDNCVCGQANGQWVFTTVLQATWNGVYNGLPSQCWNSDCDGA